MSCGARRRRSPLTALFPMEFCIWLPPWASWCAGRQVRAQTIRALPSPGQPQRPQPPRCPDDIVPADISIAPSPQVSSSGHRSLEVSELPKSGGVGAGGHRPSTWRVCRRGVVGGRREDAFNQPIDPPTPRACPAVHASAQWPLPTSPIGSQPARKGAAVWRPSWAMVVLQPWLRGPCLSLGATARGQ
jgi:hypothetical protein